MTWQTVISQRELTCARFAHGVDEVKHGADGRVTCFDEPEGVADQPDPVLWREGEVWRDYLLPELGQQFCAILHDI